jgi:hypothetical protein
MAGDGTKNSCRQQIQICVSSIPLERRLPMFDFGWGPALIMMIGITLVVGGIGVLVGELIRKDRAHKRAMRKFLASLPEPERSRFQIMQDLKDLNS